MFRMKRCKKSSNELIFASQEEVYLIEQLLNNCVYVQYFLLKKFNYWIIYPWKKIIYISWFTNVLTIFVILIFFGKENLGEGYKG